ncbi:MAG: excinuclease ABC subunit UvrC, partial [Flavobacteriales bacterium]
MKSIPENVEQILKILPQQPGVYQYFDDAGDILYVGKAKSLKNRVSSYFNKQQYENGKTKVLVRKIADIKYIVVETELDALLLENSLIKKYKPRYNIMLKDDKTYASIVVKKEDFPRVFPTRQIIRDGSEYFGPYPSGRTMHMVLELIKKLYPMRTCNLALTDKNIAAGKFKVCLEYHLGNCKGPCEGKQSAEDYNLGVQAARNILKGNYSELIRDLKQMMNEFAGRYEFELAQEVKEKIEVLSTFQSKSTIVHPSIHDVDIFSIASDPQAGYVNFMKVSNGVIVQSYTTEVKKRMEETEAEMLEYSILEIRDKFQSSSKEIFLPFELEMQLPGVL